MAFVSGTLKTIRIRTYHPQLEYEETDLVILPEILELSHVLKLCIRDRCQDESRVLDILSMGIMLQLGDVLSILRNIHDNCLTMAFHKKTPMCYQLGHYLFDTCKFRICTFTKYAIEAAMPVDESRLELVSTDYVPKEFEDFLKSSPPEALDGIDASTIVNILTRFFLKNTGTIIIPDDEEAPLIVRIGHVFFPKVRYDMQAHTYCYVRLVTKIDTLDVPEHRNFPLMDNLALYKYLEELPKEELYETLSGPILENTFLQPCSNLIKGQTFSQKFSTAHGREFPQWFNEIIDEFTMVRLYVFGKQVIIDGVITVFRACIAYLFNIPVVASEKKWQLEYLIPPPVPLEKLKNSHVVLKTFQSPSAKETTFLSAQDHCLFLVREIHSD